jgi:hypothetical protein
MEKEFIPYTEALELKELGFDEPCFGHWNHNTKEINFWCSLELMNERTNSWFINSEKQFPLMNINGCVAPLYQQVFRWFRDKHKIKIEPLMYIGDKTTYRIHNGDYNTPMFYTPEEAELECLKKLIEIVKKMAKYYRVCNKETLQGLWYTYNGSFTGFIHKKFNFCLNSKLIMDFDSELVGWLSATDSLDSLYHWFSKEDIIELQKHGWYIHEFESDDAKHYERFNHIIINQNTSKVLRIIEIKD